jgi:hypothetical protein
MMEDIRSKLAVRLAAKGLENNETEFFHQRCDSDRRRFAWNEYRYNQESVAFIGVAGRLHRLWDNPTDSGLLPGRLNCPILIFEIAELDYRLDYP